MTISKTAAQVITTVSLVGIFGGSPGSYGIAKYLSRQPGISEEEKSNMTYNGVLAGFAFFGLFLISYCIGAVAYERRKQEEEAGKSNLEKKIKGNK